MENFKGTKGEWELDGLNIHPKGLSSLIAVVQKRTSLEETEANAKLIAVSKYLLEALVEYVNADKGNISALKTTPSERRLNAINAINKATK